MTKQILIVDDDEYFIENIKIFMSLSDKGYEIITANNSDKAVDILRARNEEIDIVLLDVMMKRGKNFSEKETLGGFGTGVALGRLIKKDYPNIKVYGMSGGSSSEIYSWFNNYGDGFFKKPFSLNHFISMIESNPWAKIKEHLNIKSMILYIGIISSVLAIFTFITGKQNIFDILHIIK